MADQKSYAILAALLSLAGLVASFVYTAAYRFLRELIESTWDQSVKETSIEAKHFERIKWFYIFSDFILDYVFGGSLIALILVFGYTSLNTGFIRCIFDIIMYFIWAIGFIILFCFWFKNKFWHNVKIIKDRKQHVCCLIILLVPVICEFVIIFNFRDILYSITAFEKIERIVNLFLPKFIALLTWLIIGFVWAPFSAYAKSRKILE